MRTHPYSLAKKAIKPPLPKKEFRIFVFGPALQPDEVVKEPRCATGTPAQLAKHARYLRFVTKIELTKLDFTVDFGETEEVLDFWQKHTAAGDPASIEIQHAHRSGAVIIFPSSVGSIAELGMFALTKRISEKTLAITHSAFENSQSFFRRGLLQVFRSENGTTEFHDYSDHKSCVTAAVDFVKGKWHSALRDASAFTWLQSRGYGA